MTRAEFQLRNVVSRRERLERRSRSLESRSESNRVTRVDVEGLDVLRDVTVYQKAKRLSPYREKEQSNLENDFEEEK